MEMSNFSLWYQNGETNGSTSVLREPQPVHYYGEDTNQVPLQTPNEWGEPLPTAIRSDFSETIKIPSSMNDYYTSMEQEGALAALIKREVKVEDDDRYLRAVQPWVPYQVEENDVHCFVPTKKCNIAPNDIKTIYKCCNIKFYDKFLHFRHMIDHMEKQLMSTQCYYCNRTFNNEDDMIRHARSIHVGFKCMYCSQNFYKRAYLFKHMKFYHGYYPKKNENLCRPKRCQLKRSFKRGKEIYSTKHKWISSDAKMKPKCNIKMEPKCKMEPIYPNDETKIPNVKTEPISSNVGMDLADVIVKMEPNVTVKMEPTHYYSNEMELTNLMMHPTHINVKREPTD